MGKDIIFLMNMRYMMGKKYSFDEFCEYVKEYSPCMDDYPYVIDLKEDKYYIPMLINMLLVGCVSHSQDNSLIHQFLLA